MSGRPDKASAFGILSMLSKQLGLHENTLRQRLGKIKHLTELDFRSPNEYSQLLLAVKIWQAAEMGVPSG